MDSPQGWSTVKGLSEGWGLYCTLWLKHWHSKLQNVNKGEEVERGRRKGSIHEVLQYSLKCLSETQSHFILQKLLLLKHRKQFWFNSWILPVVQCSWVGIFCESTIKWLFWGSANFSALSSTLGISVDCAYFTWVLRVLFSVHHHCKHQDVPWQLPTAVSPLGVMNLTSCQSSFWMMMSQSHDHPMNSGKTST